MKVTLVQNTIYRALYRSTSRKIYQTHVSTDRPIEAYDEWSSALQVPFDIPIPSHLCNKIKISHELEFSFKTSKIWPLSEHFSIPIGNFINY